MNGMEKTGNDPMQQFQGNAFPSIPKQLPSLTKEPYPGFPPASPLPTPAHRLPPACSLHSRSPSQPAFCSLPPHSYRAESSPTTSLSDSVSVDDHDASVSRSPTLPPKNPAGVTPARDGLPPRKDHRRSQSDVPFAFLPSSLPVQAADAAPHSAGFVISARPPAAGTKGESQWDRGLGADGVTGSDLFSAYMNLQGFDALTSSEDNHEDLNSRESGSKTSVAGSSENEADSNSKGHAGGSSTVLCVNDSTRMGGMKPSSEVNPDMAHFSHCRSLSMDRFTGKLNYEAPAPKLLPSHGLLAAQSSKANSWDGAPNTFSLEFGNGQFTGAEMKKIMENGKLIEMAMTDPKRVKRFMFSFIIKEIFYLCVIWLTWSLNLRILANRQSAARSKERRMSKVCNFDLYRPIRVVHTGPSVYRYADRPLPGGSTKNRPSVVDLGRRRPIEEEIDHQQLIEREIDRWRLIEEEKWKKKRKRRKKKKRRRKNTLPARRPRSRAVAARGSLVPVASFSPTRGDGASPRAGRKIEV
ncbi:hypothetical protein BHE74_00050091, partial [Ensete ventricosum]